MVIVPELDNLFQEVILVLWRATDRMISGINALLHVFSQRGKAIGRLFFVSDQVAILMRRERQVPDVTGRKTESDNVCFAMTQPFFAYDQHRHPIHPTAVS